MASLDSLLRPRFLRSLAVLSLLAAARDRAAWAVNGSWSRIGPDGGEVTDVRIAASSQ